MEAAFAGPEVLKMYNAFMHFETIEEIVARIPNAKEFSVLDASSDFWQVKLNCEILSSPREYVLQTRELAQSGRNCCADHS